MELSAIRNFLVLGLPRSRTAWLANFFNRGDCLCHHELSSRVATAQEMARVMQHGAPVVGNCDPGAAYIAGELLEMLPETRLVIIKRPLEEAVSSLSKIVDSPEAAAIFASFEEALVTLEHKALVVSFNDLDKKETALAIWNHCIGGIIPFPDAQYEVLRHLNVQLDPSAIKKASQGGVVPGRLAPLNSEEQELFDLLMEAHNKSAQRENISSTAVSYTAAGNGTYTNAIASGLLTLGGAHAPLEQSYEILTSDHAVEGVKLMLADGLKIPGWGNSFYHGEPDALWGNVAHWIECHRPDIHNKISAITDFLHSAGKHIFPNPSTYTAAAAISLGVPPRCAAFLFLQGRLLAWSNIFMKGIA